MTPQLTKEKLYRDLHTQAFVEIDFRMPENFLQNAIGAFFDFLALPEAIKKHIDLSIAPNHRRGDVGYRRRKAEDHIYNDNKEFFHYHPIILEKHAEFIENNLVVKQFMQFAHPIWEKAEIALREILAMFDQDYPDTTHRMFKGDEHHIMIRFLQYDWEVSGKYLAKPHFDAGACTIAIAESTPGLRIGNTADNLQLIQHKPDTAFFMLSSNHEKLLGQPDFKPGWHDVVQLDETQIGKPYARWAIVAFFDAHGVEALPRSETHKWYKAGVI